MVMITLADAARLKSRAAQECSVQLHFHDGCGGQYFSLDEPADEKLQQWIGSYAEERHQKVVFSEDRMGFSLY